MQKEDTTRGKEEEEESDETQEWESTEALGLHKLSEFIEQTRINLQKDTTSHMKHMKKRIRQECTNLYAILEIVYTKDLEDYLSRAIKEENDVKSASVPLVPSQQTIMYGDPFARLKDLEDLEKNFERLPNGFIRFKAHPLELSCSAICFASFYGEAGKEFLRKHLPAKYTSKTDTGKRKRTIGKGFRTVDASSFEQCLVTPSNVPK
jgi:hypothetical protein